MKRRIWTPAILLVLWLAISAVASLTITYVEGFGPMTRVDIAFSTGTNNYDTGSTKPLYGHIDRVVVPAVACTGATFDVTLTDAAGVDVLGGAGAAVATNTLTSLCPGIARGVSGAATNISPYAVASALTLTVTNIGASMTGTISVYLAP